MSISLICHLQYLIVFYIIIFISFILYAYLIIIWVKYFNKKTNLSDLMTKNANLETSSYMALNIYNLMIFNNFTIEEITQYIYPEYYNPGETISIIKIFYERLLYAFNSKRHKNSLGKSFYQDFENSYDFTCQNLFNLNDNFLEELYTSKMSNNRSLNIKKELIKLCNNTKITESNEVRAVFERHIQYIKNGLTSIDDYSYEGLIEHLKKGYLGKVSIFFNFIIIYLFEVLFSVPHSNSSLKILNIHKKNILITEIIFVVIDIIFILIIIFFFISKIKDYCDQILLLKNTFKIFENQD